MDSTNQVQILHVAFSLYLMSLGKAYIQSLLSLAIGKILG